jgi:hypothetical protein
MLRGGPSSRTADISVLKRKINKDIDEGLELDLREHAPLKAARVGAPLQECTVSGAVWRKDAAWTGQVDSHM